MGATAYTDLIIPELLNTETMVDFTKKFDFAMMGAAERVDVGAGHTVSIRKFNELTGTAKRMTTAGSYPISNATQNEDIAVILHLIEKWGAEDLAKVTSGLDVIGAISAMVAQYWVGQARDKMLIVLESLFNRTAGLLATTNKNDVFVDANTGQVYLTPATAIDGLAKLGANMDDIQMWAMHSLTRSILDKADALETNHNLEAYGNNGGAGVKTFLGKPILVDDSCTRFTGTTCTLGGFRTYGLGIGSMALGIQQAISTEKLRSENAVDLLISQFHFAPHVRGCKYVGTSENPTDAQLATVTNWELAYASAKQVRVIAIDHN
jgi:hypothetical protein